MRENRCDPITIDVLNTNFLPSLRVTSSAPLPPLAEKRCPFSNASLRISAVVVGFVTLMGDNSDGLGIRVLRGG